MAQIPDLRQRGQRPLPDRPGPHKNQGHVMRRLIVIAIPYFWLLALFLIPFVIVLKIALSDTALARPPYLPQIDFTAGWQGFADFLSQLDLENFVFLAQDDLYWKAYLSSLQIALIATLLTLAIGYPMAYAMARAPQEWRAALMMLVILPFWTSFLIRVYSWMGILSQNGVLNSTLIKLGLIDQPWTILNTDIAVYIGITYTYLPFMILPIYAALEKMDDSLIEAAEDLGCSRIKAFWLITAPLSKSGVMAGCLLVFIPALGEFVIPSLLGGSKTLMIGKVLYEEFLNNRDWPVASAVAIVLLLILVIPIVLFQRNQQRQSEEP
jgi:putrescine transport system permease protein